MNTAIAERAAIAEGYAPCRRCRVVLDTEGELAEHLRREHLQPEYQARREAHEAATGIKRDADGLCVGCRRAADHSPSCYVAKRAERIGYRV